MDDVEVSPYNTLPEVLKDFSLSDNIVIYDSTLRDGEQMPGISFSPEQKLELAKAFLRLKQGFLLYLKLR